MKLVKEKKGITLIAVIVTIIVLLIISGISVSLLFGDNGILTKAKEARIEQEEANFKYKVNELVSDYVANMKLNVDNAYDQLVTSLNCNNLNIDDSNIINGTLVASSVSQYDNSLINEATITLNNGEVIYSQSTNTNNISIMASESSGISAEGQNVDITIKSSSNSLDSIISYTEWTNSTTEPTSGWGNLTLSGSNSLKIGTTYNSSSVEGDYYLWIKIILNGNDTIKRFGPYTIQGTPTADNIIINKTIDTTQADPVTTIKLGVTKTYFGYGLKYSTDNGSTYNYYANDLTYTNTQITNAGGQITIIAEYTNGTVTINKNITIGVIIVANSPLLATGMTGLYWDDSGQNEITVTADNKANWYNYDNKKWANAKTADGSYWVWIPRYEYKIPTPHTSNAQTIDVKFIPKTKTTADSGYIIEPAFTFGTTELDGIWVAKFEASGTTSAVDVKPNVTSLRSVDIGNMFTACRNIETNTRYGWNSSGAGIDSHLMKNIEWGACSYLSSSQYGKTGEIWINPNSNYITGQAGTSVSAAGTTTTYAYNDTTYGVNASTTGNIYGIYDISGGAWEYTAAYVNNGTSYLTAYGGANVVNADSKYKDVYTSSGDTYAGNYEANASKKGDAVYETSTTAPGASSWYEDYSYMPRTSYPFFMRGSAYYDGNAAGAFNFDCLDGSAASYIGFRPVLALNSSF